MVRDTSRVTIFAY